MAGEGYPPRMRLRCEPVCFTFTFCCAMVMLIWWSACTPQGRVG